MRRVQKQREASDNASRRVTSRASALYRPAQSRQEIHRWPTNTYPHARHRRRRRRRCRHQAAPRSRPRPCRADHRTGERRLLRRRDVPPRDPRLHGAGRRSDRHRHGRIEQARPQGRIQRRAARARRLLDGAHQRPEQRQQPVLHLPRRRALPRQASTPSGARSRAAWNMSTRCPRASRRASRARSSRRPSPDVTRCGWRRSGRHPHHVAATLFASTVRRRREP